MKDNYKLYDLEGKKILGFYNIEKDIINLLYIHKYGEDDFGYWNLEVLKSEYKDIKDENELIKEIFRDTHIGIKYQNEGVSSRGDLESILKEIDGEFSFEFSLKKSELRKLIKENEENFYVF